MNKENLKIALNAIDAVVEDVKKFVKDNGGFISTHDLTCDTMYAYVIDWNVDNVTEERVIAIRVVNGDLEIATTFFKNDVYEVALTENDFDDEDWMLVGSYSDTVLTSQTILSIAESIDQYVQMNN